MASGESYRASGSRVQGPAIDGAGLSGQMMGGASPPITMSQDNSNLRANWTRTGHHNLSDPAVEHQLARDGRAIIASWTHKEADADVLYYFEPEAEDRYEVVLRSPELEDEYSERFNSRSAGGTFNKELMRNPDINEALEVHHCGADTADGEPCQVQVDGPDERCHIHEESEDEDEEEEAEETAEEPDETDEPQEAEA